VRVDEFGALVGLERFEAAEHLGGNEADGR
jgi:hypothetical protein